MLISWFLYGISRICTSRLFRLIIPVLKIPLVCINCTVWDAFCKEKEGKCWETWETDLILLLGALFYFVIVAYIVGIIHYRCLLRKPHWKKAMHDEWRPGNDSRWIIWGKVCQVLFFCFLEGGGIALHIIVLCWNLLEKEGAKKAGLTNSIWIKVLIQV